MDYLIMEAVALKIADQDEAERKNAERNHWKQDTSALESARG